MSGRRLLNSLRTRPNNLEKSGSPPDCPQDTPNRVSEPHTITRTGSIVWGKRLPRSQSPIVVGDTPAALASDRSEG
jgi:hypothetical protein